MGHKAVGYCQKKIMWVSFGSVYIWEGVETVNLTQPSFFTSPEASNIHPAASKHPEQGFI